MRTMKKLIIFLVLAVPALCYGWMNVVQLGGGVESSGGSSTERLYPDGDLTSNWDQWSSTPHWSRVDEDYAAPTESDGGLAGGDDNIESFTFANVSSMGGSDSCTQLVFSIWVKYDSTIGDDFDVDYSTDGGSSWSGSPVTVSSLSSSYNYETATFSGLSLTQTQVNALAIKMHATVGNSQNVTTSAVSVEITYE